MQFLSEEWSKSYVDIWQNSEEFKDGIKKFSGNFIYRVSDREDLQPLQINVQKGEIVYFGGLDNSPIEFDMWTSFDGWQRVVNGELSVKKAMMTPGFGFKGSKIKAAMYIGSFEKSIAMMRDIETEFS